MEKSLFDHWKSCWKQYANFKGRARRREYWGFVLFQFLIFIALQILTFITGIGTAISGGAMGYVNWEMLAGAGSVYTLMYIVLSLFRLGSILPSLAAAVRRLHDTGRSGWWALMGWIPLIFMIVGVILFEMPDMQIFAILLTVFAAISGLATGIILIIWLASDGQFGPNKYGQNPKEEELNRARLL